MDFPRHCEVCRSLIDEEIIKHQMFICPCGCERQYCCRDCQIDSPHFDECVIESTRLVNIIKKKFNQKWIRKLKKLSKESEEDHTWYYAMITPDLIRFTFCLSCKSEFPGMVFVHTSIAYEGLYDLYQFYGCHPICKDNVLIGDYEAVYDWHMENRERARIYIPEFKHVNDPREFRYRMCAPGENNRKIFDSIKGKDGWFTMAEVNFQLYHLHNIYQREYLELTKDIRKLNIQMDIVRKKFNGEWVHIILAFLKIMRKMFSLGHRATANYICTVPEGYASRKPLAIILYACYKYPKNIFCMFDTECIHDVYNHFMVDNNTRIFGAPIQIDETSPYKAITVDKDDYMYLSWEGKLVGKGSFKNFKENFDFILKQEEEHLELKGSIPDLPKDNKDRIVEEGARKNSEMVKKIQEYYGNMAKARNAVSHQSDTVSWVEKSDA